MTNNDNFPNQETYLTYTFLTGGTDTYKQVLDVIGQHPPREQAERLRAFLLENIPMQKPASGVDGLYLELIKLGMEHIDFDLLRKMVTVAE